MGICTSCLRNRRSAKRNYGRSEEIEPLLNTTFQNENYLKFVSRTLVRVVAALKSGKLPSQDQVNSLVKASLKSNLLLENGEGVGELSVAGYRVLRDLRKVLGLAMVFGMEKNYDDKIQNILYHARILAASPPPAANDLINFEPLDPAVQFASELETDIPLFLSSIRVLFSLFVTSTSFRILFSNLLLLTRQYFFSSLVEGVRKVEDLAVKVESVAETAQNLAQSAANAADRVHGAAEGVSLAATGIENVAKDAEHVALNLDLSSSNVPAAKEEAMDELQSLKTRTEKTAERTLGEVRQVNFSHQEQEHNKETPMRNADTTRKQLELDADRKKAKINQEEEWKDAIVDSVQKILIQIHQSPAQITALRTVFSISQKWINQYRNLRALRLNSVSRSSESEVELEFGLDVSDTPQWKHLNILLRDSKDLVERLAGERSLDPLLQAFEDVIIIPFSSSSSSQSNISDTAGSGQGTRPVENVEEGGSEEPTDESRLLSDFVDSFKGIANSSLSTGSDSEQMGYITSPSFHGDVGLLVEKVRRVRKEAEASPVSSNSTPDNATSVSPDTPTTSHSTPATSKFLNEFDIFISALSADRTSRRLLRSLRVLGQDIERYIRPPSDEDDDHHHHTSSKLNSSSIAGVSVLKTTLSDLVGYIIPKIVGGVVESLFRGKRDARNALPHPGNLLQSTDGLDYDLSSDAGAMYTEEVTREWKFPFPLPRVELVSDINNDLSSDSRSDSRWLEGVLDPRLMRIRVRDDKEVQLYEEEETYTSALGLTTCFSWCCCSGSKDPYVDAEAGYAHVIHPEPENGTFARGRRRETKGSRTNVQTDLASLLTPSSIAITQWSETRVEFYSSVSPEQTLLSAPAVAVDAEPLLVDVDVPGSEDEPHPANPANHGNGAPMLVDFDVSNSIPEHSAPVDSVEFDSDDDEQDDHLLAIVERQKRGLEGSGKTKTVIDTRNKIHLHVEGVLSSLPSLPATVDTTSPSAIPATANSTITQRLTLENISYYARYNILSSVFGSWLGVGDEGLLDLEFEFRDIKTSKATSVRDGAELDMDIEVDASTDMNTFLHLNEEGTTEPESEFDSDTTDVPFKISNTQFTLPRTLNITPRLRTLPNRTLLSRFTTVPRKILLALLLRPVVLPLAQVVVRRELEKAIGQGIENGSEVVGRMVVRTLRGARGRARDRSAKIKSDADDLDVRRGEVNSTIGPQNQGTPQVSFGDLWESLSEVLGDSIENEEGGPEVHTSVKEVGLKGVQIERTTIEDDHDENDPYADAGDNGRLEEGEGQPSATTTTVAIGLAPQLLPDKVDVVASALPPTDSPADVADRVVAETQTAVLAAVDDVVEDVKGGLKQGVEDLQEVVQGAVDVVQGVGEGVEQIRKGVEQGATEAKEEVNGADGGWRSTVFDL